MEAGVLTVANSAGRPDRLRVFEGHTSGALFVGWNRPLAGALAAAGRQALLEWVKGQIDDHRRGESGGGRKAK